MDKQFTTIEFLEAEKFALENNLFEGCENHLDFLKKSFRGFQGTLNGSLKVALWNEEKERRQLDSVREIHGIFRK